MAKAGAVDSELQILIQEAIEADLFATESAELGLAKLVAAKGQAVLDRDQRDLWEKRVLPILSKPLPEQIAIASIIRRGGYVPRKIEF